MQKYGFPKQTRKNTSFAKLVSSMLIGHNCPKILAWKGELNQMSTVSKGAKQTLDSFNWK
jgi:hypothetical protein